MVKFAIDFFPPDFREWKSYLDEMAITLQIAIWGTLLAMVFAVPFGLLASKNIAPWWISQPVRRALDSARAINEMMFAMLFVVVVGMGPVRRGSGTVCSYHGHPRQTVFGSRRSHRSQAGRRHSCYRGIGSRRDCVWRHPASVAVMGLVFALPFRIQRTLGKRGRNGWRRGNRNGALGNYSGVSVSPDMRRHPDRHRGVQLDRHGVIAGKKNHGLTKSGLEETSPVIEER